MPLNQLYLLHKTIQVLPYIKCLTYAVSFAYKHILSPSKNISQLAHDTQINRGVRGWVWVEFDQTQNQIK